MNPLLSRLQPYPFERLRRLFAGVTPNPDLRPISLGIGEPKHATPQMLKDALAAKPGPAPVVDVVVNPARLGKAIRKINPNEPVVEAIIGTEDKLRSGLAIRLEGGKELKASVTVDLKLSPRWLLYSFTKGVASDRPVADDPIKK